MPSLDVNVAILQGERLLLTRREDFEVWCLPGGGVEPGETPAHASVREVAEETGLIVELTGLVGVYSQPLWLDGGRHTVVFTARVVGGEGRLLPAEVLDIEFFDPHQLPADILASHRQRIADALRGAGGGVAWFHDRLWPFEPGLARRDLYRQRDLSGQSKAEFYFHYLGQPGSVGDTLEVAQGRPCSVAPSKACPDGAPQAAYVPIIDLGVNVAILQDGKVLMTKRDDFEVWCLPGGHLEAQESLAQAARRETYEEVGLEVELNSLVGVYSEPHCYDDGLHVVLFTARPVGGALHLQAEEVLEARYFGPHELPEACLYGHRQRASDALQGLGGGVVWAQMEPWPFDPAVTQAEVYSRRDRSGLPRREFYYQHFNKPGPHGDRLEVSS